MDIDGDLKVAFNFLHQLKAGSSAIYKIDVEANRTYTLAFDKAPLKGSYRIKTALNSSTMLSADSRATLNLQAGPQQLFIEVIEGGDQSLKYLQFKPNNF
ncbi:MAG: hypothetical protein RIC19_13555 [Phaeodactylibacter sp.]|uniref:hypothetical protein n=1 Tax=Phaeodactylibacter sp. TaxID=1940289 RepID=UPI0032EF8769